MKGIKAGRNAARHGRALAVGFFCCAVAACGSDLGKKMQEYSLRLPKQGKQASVKDSEETKLSRLQEGRTVELPGGAKAKALRRYTSLAGDKCVLLLRWKTEPRPAVANGGKAADPVIADEKKALLCDHEGWRYFPVYGEAEAEEREEGGNS
jgi:hypothetical protein